MDMERFLKVLESRQQEGQEEASGDLGTAPERPKVEVCEHRCNECLFGPNRIVSASAATQHIQKTLEEDTWFQCHKGTLTGRNLVCKGFWDEHRGDVPPLRLAIAYDFVTFVKVPDVER